MTAVGQLSQANGIMTGTLRTGKLFKYFKEILQCE